MIPILTLAEIKEVERKTASASGLTEYDMIMSAGEAVFETIKSMLEENQREREGRPPGEEVDDIPPHREEEKPRREEASIAFVCGVGHNGGDALSAALLTSQAGYPIVIYQIHSDRGY